MLISRRAWAPPALFAALCACSAPDPVDEIDPPDDVPPVGCEPAREERAATSSNGFEVVVGPWCEACPFEDQAKLSFLDSFDVKVHAGATGKAVLLANASTQSGTILTFFDPAAGWADPVKIPLGSSTAVMPRDVGPYFLSDWHGILRLREPDGVEENISCGDESWVPAALDVHDGILHVVAGWRRDGELDATLLTRPLNEPETPWSSQHMGSFDDGPMQAARDGDGHLMIIGVRGADAVLVRGEEEQRVPLGLVPIDPFEDEREIASQFQLVAGESFVAVVTQRPTNLAITFGDGGSLGFPTPNTFVNPECDGSTACGGRCEIREHTTGSPSTFALGKYLFVAFVETTVDRTTLLEDVPCPGATNQVCDCREVLERDESTSKVVFARFDSETRNGDRALEVDVPLLERTATSAQLLGERVVLALSSELTGEARLGTLPAALLTAN